MTREKAFPVNANVSSNSRYFGPDDDVCDNSLFGDSRMRGGALNMPKIVKHSGRTDSIYPFADRIASGLILLA